MNIKRHIPNGITLGNLYCGFVSIGLTVGEYYKSAALLIFIGMILDGLDGRIARLLNVKSDIGKQLDSLADLVTFGIAPCMLFSYTNKIDGGFFDFALAGLFLRCGAYRLARFNSDTTEDNSYFIGMPITAAGGILAITTLLYLHIPAAVNLFIISILSYMMVSRIRVPSLKNISLPNYGTLVTVLIGFGVLLIDISPYLPLAITLYFATPIYCLYVFYRIYVLRARRKG